MTPLCFIDTETTGLDPDRHAAYEVCWWLDGQEAPTTAILPHSLAGADEKALEVGGYHARGILPGWHTERRAARRQLRHDLTGVTLVGSNPAFDASFLRRTLGCTPWHHRLINVAEGAMWLFGWDRPKGLADVSIELRARGHVIPEPDHTAEGDVRATRAVYYALRAETPPRPAEATTKEAVA
jgi:hypothetical protein